MIREMILIGAVLAGVGIGLYSCGPSSTAGSGSGLAGSGTVALYATDAPLDGASRVEIGIVQIKMEHTGTGLSCIVFSPEQPYRVDLTDLQGTMQLLDLASCPSGEYNRLVVTLEQSPVDVLYDYDGDGTPESYVCSLTDYDPEGNGLRPNRTLCDPSAGECYLYVTGAVNVIANQTTDVALDFSVKDSEIEIDTSTTPPSCTVAFKVYPLHAEGVKDHMKGGNKDHEIKGKIDGNSLDTSNNTFQLVGHGMTFTVNYDDSIGQGVDQILELASEFGLAVEVECSSLELADATCTAKDISVKVNGTAGEVDRQAMMMSMDIDGDSSPDISVMVAGEMEGVRVGRSVEAEIIGYDETLGVYIAKEAEHDEH